jgi:hypothetical protein
VSLETILCTFTNAQATTPTTTTTTTSSSTTTTTTSAATTTTTSARTTPPTLPYTGGEISTKAALALALIALGGLTLAAIRGRGAD